MILWFTGLSGAGKSTIAHQVYQNLQNAGHAVEYLDGDVIRDIFPQKGFSKADRDAHIHQMGFLGSRLEAHGVIVIAAFISPYHEARQFVRNLCQDFHEIYVSTTLEVCEKRDVKGLYARARQGEIKQFTGLDDPYEAPEHPELTIDTAKMPLNMSLEMVMQYIHPLLKEAQH